MLIFELADQTRVAVRGSGTEPKIKYYLFAQRRPEGKQFRPAELAAIKPEVRRSSRRSGNGCRRTPSGGSRPNGLLDSLRERAIEYVSS